MLVKLLMGGLLVYVGLFGIELIRFIFDLII